MACFQGGNIAVGQSAQDGFGKNRIQYQTFNWQILSSNSVDVFFYDGAESLARSAVEISELEFRRISELFGATPNSKIKVFLYSSSNHRLMSNVGLSESASTAGGKTNFTKSIVEVAYEGSLAQLKTQISAGIAQILIRDMLFGGSFKDALQNSFLLTLPDWFIGGAIKYAAEGWSNDLDDFLRSYSDVRKIRQPANYVGEEAYLVGHSIWNYVAERYGKTSIGNILNLTRIIRNEESAISGTLGIPYSGFVRDWKIFYYNLFQQNKSFLIDPQKQQRYSSNYLQKDYRQMSISRDGNLLAFAQFWKGKFQVVAWNKQVNKGHVIFRGGANAKHQYSEGEFPAVAISPDNTILVAYPHKGKWKGVRLTAKGKVVQRFSIFDSFEEVYGIAVSPDGKRMAISGSLDGFSDIFEISLRSEKLTRLTKDIYDDLDPAYALTGDTIFFSSNRPSADTLPLSEKKLPDLKRRLSVFSINKKSDNQWAKPVLYMQSDANLTRLVIMGSGNMYCLSDQTGIQNVALITRHAKPEVKILTSFRYSIRDFALNDDERTLAFVVHYRLKPYLYIDQGFELAPLSLPENLSAKSTQTSDDSLNRVILLGKKPWLKDSNRIDFRNYIFEDEKVKVIAAETSPSGKRPERVRFKKETKLQPIDVTGPISYQPRVTADYLTTGLVVHPIPSWGLGTVVDFSMHDLFENHRINGGMTTFFTDMELRNNLAFFEYHFLPKRLDFKLRADRTSIQNTSFTQSIRQRDVLLGLSGTMAYPLTNSLRVEATPFFQTTKRVVFDFNPNVPFLGGKDVNVYYFGLAGQLVFDNSTTLGMNMISGTRMKLRGQYQVANKYGSKDFGELFADVRTYLPIHKDIVFALRGSLGHFFGNGAKKYMLGGMDNWLFRSYEVSSQKDDPLRGLNQNNQIISSDEAQTDWLFHRYVTNLRGFKYNQIYGRSFMLFNGEFRFPIIKYFYKGPINSNFWRNLQLTAFSDIGTAWTGVGPFNQNNSLNTRQINEGNFSVRVKSYENPFLMGYGFGARTMVLGYYLKFDMAWGEKNRIVGNPNYYFTLGYDF